MTRTLWAAAQEATRRRIHSGGEVSSHGRVHMGLAAAHLGMAEEAFGRLEVMATGASMYDSLMCSHEPNGRIFNLDANGAMPEIMNRMLVRSHPGSLDLLPALPKAWPRGEIRGIGPASRSPSTAWPGTRPRNGSPWKSPAGATRRSPWDSRGRVDRLDQGHRGIRPDRGRSKASQPRAGWVWKGDVPVTLEVVW